MPNRFSHEQLVDKALLALREAMAEVERRQGPIAHKEALRYILASLYTDGEMWPFTQFWQAATRPAKDGPEVYAIYFGRIQTMRSALAAISRLHGVEPW